ncbi:hypothetical protein BGX27_008675 [Mortierella sp. AM989]|nr:hypothetical protein BGX27_008675 [Mortierella sp. AM989]
MMMTASPSKKLNSFPCNPVQIGEGYIRQGDQYRDRGDFKEAVEHYEKASEYCPKRAQDRLEGLPGSCLSDPHSFARERSRLAREKETNDQPLEHPSKSLKSWGPFFPILDLPHQKISNTHTPTNIIYTVADAPDTTSLVTSFIDADMATKATICSQTQEVIKLFANPSVAVLDLVILSTIPNRDIFLDIISQMYKVLGDTPLLDMIGSITLQALAVMMSHCPHDISLNDMRGVFLDILCLLVARLGSIPTGRYNLQLIPPLNVISSILDCMILKQVTALDHLVLYEPLSSLLDDLTLNSDAVVCFMATYAKQALALIGSVESLQLVIVRRDKLALAVTTRVEEEALSFDPTKFESVYQNFSKTLSLSPQSAWYRGLMYVDCMMRRQDWSRLEQFILESTFASRDEFSQGLCLRLERIAATESVEEVRCGAIKFIRALETTSPLSVQHVAQYALQRLEKNGHIKLSTARIHSNSSGGATSCKSPGEPKGEIIPVWDPRWLTTSRNALIKIAQCNILLRTLEPPINFKVVQEIQSTSSKMKESIVTDFHSKQLRSELNQLRNDARISEESMSTSSNIREVNAALEAFYKPQLSIKRVLGDEMSLEDCYINLTIVEAPAQRQKDKIDLEKQKTSFGRSPKTDETREVPVQMQKDKDKGIQAAAFDRIHRYGEIAGTNAQTSIPLEEMFNKRKLRDGRRDTPRRILVQGRAGIGKTTLCKKLVHAYQSGLWRDRFEAVLWIPLRRLKKKIPLASALTTHVGDGKVLFILDGLDEVVCDTKYEKFITLTSFLKDLLLQHHVIITSRPYGIDMSLLPELDLELETVGFNSQNVKDYISKVLSHESAIEVEDLIERTPLIQGLVNIPVQLDLICYIWNSLPLNNKEVTMTGLYQTFVRKLWCSDVSRRQKQNDANPLSIGQLKNARSYKIDELIAIENEYLGYLAFKGIQDHMIEFDESKLLDAMEELDTYRKKANKPGLPMQLFDTLKQTSFLHSVDTDLDDGIDDSMRSWHFLHLTFQEYFAASWLTRHLLAGEIDPMQKPILMMSKDETRAFIQKHKYNPRYEIVWWMVVGQLENDALENFFGLLQEAPRDLIGGRHQRLLAGCLREARYCLQDYVVERVEVELMQWLCFEMTLFGDKNCEGYLGRQSVFPEHLLITCLNQSKEAQKYALKAFKGRHHLTSSALHAIHYMALHDEDSRVKCSAAEALGVQSSLPEFAISTLVAALCDRDSDFTYSVAKALGAQAAVNEFAFPGFSRALQDSDFVVRLSAMSGLGFRSSLSGDIVEQLVYIMLEDVDQEVAPYAARVVGSQSPLSEVAIHGLIFALSHAEFEVRNTAAQALGAHSKLSDSTILTLSSECPGSSFEKDVIAISLGSKTVPSDSVISDFINVIQSEDECVSKSAAVALGTQCILPESAIQTLIDAFRVRYWCDEKAIIQILIAQPNLSESVITTLVRASHDKSRGGVVFSKSIVAELLASQSTLPESVMLTLTSTLDLRCRNTVNSVAKALSSQSTLSESTVLALIHALHGEGWGSRGENCMDFNKSDKLSISSLLTDRPCKLSEFVITSCISKLKDKNPQLRTEAAETLGTQCSLPESAALALVGALHDTDLSVVSSVIQALKAQITLTDNTMLTFLGTLSEKGCKFGRFPFGEISNPIGLPESVIHTLVRTFGRDLYKRSLNLQIFGAQPLILESTSLALIGPLPVKARSIETSVIETSTIRYSLHGSTTLTRIDEMDCTDLESVGSTGIALDAQIRTLCSAMWDLITTLGGRSSRDEIVGSCSTPLEAYNLALIDALQDKDLDVRSSHSNRWTVNRG